MESQSEAISPIFSHQLNPLMAQSDYSTSSKEDIELSYEIKKLNKNIDELKGVISSFSDLLTYLIEQQNNISEKQELMEMNMIYEKYGKPLEKDHKGKFACITPEGDYVIGEDSVDAEKKADEKGLDDFVLFHIGNPGGGIDM